MQVQQPHLEWSQNAAAPIRERANEDFQDAVSRYLPALYKRAHGFVGNPLDAEDVVQDALLSAYKHLDQYNGTAKMTTWLTSIVINSALSQLRRRPRQPHVSLDERSDEEHDYPFSDRLADTRPSPESDCIGSEMFGQIMHFVTELSPALRKAIRLRVLEGMTTLEAADILGVSGGTVKAQVSQARSKLKRMMRGA
jgi:RNA polymerase sigma-70 factor (ECF subfamily)